VFWERPCSSRGRERGILAALPRSLVRAVTAPSDHPASPLHGVMRNLGDSLRKRVEMGSDVVTRVRSSTKPGVRIGQGQTIHPSAAPDAVRRRHATDGVDLGGRASPELSLPQTRRRRWLAAQDRGWRCLGHSAVAPSTHRVARPPPTPCKGGRHPRRANCRRAAPRAHTLTTLGATTSPSPRRSLGRLAAADRSG